MTDKQKQCLLAFFGCLTPGEIDGIWGPKSQKALEGAQSRLGLPAGPWEEGTEAALLERLPLGRLPQGDFWSGIRHFTREEFRCRCGSYHAPYCDGFPAEPDETLVRLADDIREHFGAPAIPSSGLRCPRHNADSGGVSNSRHLSGKALDFMVQGVSGQALLSRVQADPRTRYAYLIEDPWIHMDVN